MKAVCNAFSAQMLPNLQVLEKVSISFQRISKEEFDHEKEDAQSFVGHADTAEMLGVECHRGNLDLDSSTELYLAQFCGGRLPEGVNTLPAEYPMKYYRVKLR